MGEICCTVCWKPLNVLCFGPDHTPLCALHFLEYEELIEGQLPTTESRWLAPGATGCSVSGACGILTDARRAITLAAMQSANPEKLHEMQ